jgi:thioredoxin reductase (NADPH)
VGIPGDELAARAYQQAWLFGADFTLSDEVVGLEVRDGERVVHLSNGHAVHTRTVVLTMGVAYRHLEIPALERLIGAGVFYGATSAEAQAMKGKHVYLVGGGNSAGQAVTHLARYAEHVTMLVRDSSLAVSMSDYLIKEINRCENVDIQFNTEVVGGGGEQHLEHLTLQNNDTDETWTVPTTALFVLIGAVPHTAWLPPEIKCVGRGYIVTGQDLLDDDGQPPAGWPLRRLPLPLETSVPGVFAAGDVRHRAIRRVASAVGEGSITVQHIHQYLSE